MRKKEPKNINFVNLDKDFEEALINEVFKKTVIKKPIIKNKYKNYDATLDKNVVDINFNLIKNNYTSNIKTLTENNSIDTLKIPKTVNELIEDHEIFYMWIDIIAVWRYFEVLLAPIKNKHKDLKNPLEKYGFMFNLVYKANKIWLKSTSKKYATRTIRHGNLEDDLNIAMDIAFLQCLEQHGALIIGSPTLAIKIPFHKRLSFLTKNAARKEIINLAMPFKKNTFFNRDEKNDNVIDINSIEI